MIGLDPDTEYTATFVVHYGNESSDSFQYSFNTADLTSFIFPPGSVKVEEKYVVVIVIESLVALAMLIALVVTLKRLRSKRSNEEMFLPSHLSAEPIELRNRKNGYRTSTTIKQEDKKTNEKASTVRFVSGSYEETAMGKQVGDGDDDVYEDLDGHVTREPISNVTDVDFLEMISEGTLTTVFIGTCSIPTKVECAIKAPTLGVNEQEIQDFEEEASALLKFHTSHSIDASNILQYYGFVNEGQENPALIMEYCSNGELGDWLGKSGDRANVDDLEQIIYDIACGMEYLAARKIFHGHLTSFNVLLNSDLVPKIKGIGDGAMSTKSARWQAPERLVGSKTEPTEAADVWSYGVIIWEIFSQGIKPYEEVAETEVEAAIKDGAKLNRPELCPDAYNGFIVTCMQRDPASRPTFTDIVDAFKSTEGSSTHPDHEDPEDSNMQPELEDSGIYQNEETAKTVT
ncbi:ephrin type-A receptor 4a-like [Pecten maximus]|uniref:ephrin type-A receptor 4a-like n=1 Tax=Pecten maximus TaxID=6579 RepID=UPI00145909F1|nr:ephrin type-A receptor 4a-like [Pecten maximus]